MSARRTGCPSQASVTTVTNFVPTHNPPRLYGEFELRLTFRLFPGSTSLCLRWQLNFLINLPTRPSPMCLSSTPDVSGATPGQTRRTRFFPLERLQTNTLQAELAKIALDVRSVSGPRVHKKLLCAQPADDAHLLPRSHLLWAEVCRTFEVSSFEKLWTSHRPIFCTKISKCVSNTFF